MLLLPLLLPAALACATTLLGKYSRLCPSPLTLPPSTVPGASAAMERYGEGKRAPGRARMRVVLAVGSPASSHGGKPLARRTSPRSTGDEVSRSFGLLAAETSCDAVAPIEK